MKRLLLKRQPSLCLSALLGLVSLGTSGEVQAGQEMYPRASSQLHISAPVTQVDAQGLKVGVREIEITPPVGTAMAGGFQPRISVGVEDPLYVKAIVLESGGKCLAYVTLDLIALGREVGNRCVEKASRQSGLPAENIVWACTHTHTGPYTGPIFGVEEGGINQSWLTSLPDSFAQAVAEADARKQPASMCHLRTFVVGLGHNRRVVFKNGHTINTWNLDSAGEDLGQSLGSEGPVDPELGILAFDDPSGRPTAVLFHYTLHTNVNFGSYLSADYPGVVAARLRERYGSSVVTLFIPGAFADINVYGLSYREVGNQLADAILKKMDARKPASGPVSLAVAKRELDVEYRDLAANQEERIEAAFFKESDRDVFRKELAMMRQEGLTQTRTLLQAWRIGDIGFASQPGELFVKWGLKMRRESPFAWTYPVMLGGDYVGYLVTEEAWKSGGYESLVARSAKPTAASVSAMIDAALALLNQIHSPTARETAGFP